MNKLKYYLLFAIAYPIALIYYIVKIILYKPKEQDVESFLFGYPIPKHEINHEPEVEFAVPTDEMGAKFEHDVLDDLPEGHPYREDSVVNVIMSDFSIDVYGKLYIDDYSEGFLSEKEVYGENG